MVLLPMGFFFVCGGKPWLSCRAWRRGAGGEHDTNAARTDREGSSQGTLEQALEPKRDCRDVNWVTTVVHSTALGSNGAASSSFRASMSWAPRSYAALARSRVTVVR